MLYNELEQEDILSGVRVRLATIAYADILLCSIGTIYEMRQTPAISRRITHASEVNTTMRKRLYRCRHGILLVSLLLTLFVDILRRSYWIPGSSAFT